MRAAFTLLASLIMATSSLLANNCEAYFTFEIGENGVVSLDNDSYTNCDSWWYEWQLGEEGPFDSENLEWEAEPGVHNVCLTITTPNCTDTYCQEITVPGPCSGVTISLESLIDPNIAIELAWALEELDGDLIDDGLLEMILGGANGEIDLCLEAGCYSLTLEGPVDFGFEVILLAILLEDAAIEPLSITLDGNVLIVDFSINSDCSGGGDCPQEYGASPLEDCGCFAMEIGSFVEGESVVWNFGDGTGETGGHFADHCYEANGVYEVIAIYNSPTCQQETYTISVEVNCFENCGLEVETNYIDCDSFLWEAYDYPEGALIEWFIDDELIESGNAFDWSFEAGQTFQLCAAYETPDCPEGVWWCETFTTEGCGDCPQEYGAVALNDCGCFAMEIGSFVEGESVVWTFGDGSGDTTGHFVEHCYGANGFYQVTAIYNSPFCQNETYTFEVVVDCFNDCELDVEYVQSECGSGVYEAFNYPENAQLFWFVDSETDDYASGVNSIEVNFEEAGEHYVCAFYETPECPEGVWWCHEFVIEQCEGSCPDDVWSGALNDCGCYGFEIGSFQEGESVVWDFGDGTTTEGGHYIEHCYETDGEYIVTGWYTSNDCEGALYTIGVVNIDCEEGDCGLSISYEETDNGFIFTADAPDGVTVWWDLGDGSEATGYVVDNSYDVGWYTVCAFYESEGCPMGAEACIDIDIQDDGGDCPEEIYMAQQGDCGCYVFEIGSFAEGESVMWEFGDGTIIEEGGHFAEHCYEEDGEYVVTAWYTANNCEGALYTLGVADVNCTEEPCPQEVWMDSLEDCGCYAFEIGSFAEGEEVIWDFGDGSEAVGGHFIEHCYEENGEYIITAWYTSDSCEGQLYTLGLVEVDCEGGCTEVNISMDSFVNLNGPNFVEYQVSELGDVVLSGVCQYNAELAYHDVLGCLEDGCYVVEIWGNEQMADDQAFFTNASANGQDLDIVDGPYYDGSYMTYTFSLNSDCDEGPCDLEIDISEYECGWVLVSAYGAPENAQINWYVDGVYAQSIGFEFDWQFEDDYDHTICASYETDDCPEGVEACIEFESELCSECPENIYVGEMDYCGCFEFEAGSNAEGICVDWDFGDGNTANCIGNYNQHCYPQPGAYTVTVFYTSNDCPEGVTLTTIVEFECDDCIDVGFSFDSEVANGGPVFIEWLLSDDEGNPIEDGVCQYSENDPFCDATACLAAGCYKIDVWANTAINSTDLFESGAFIDGVAISDPMQVEADGENHISYMFGVNSDCDVSVGNIDEHPFLTVYPVPAADNLTIFARSSLLGAMVSLHDLQGKLIIEEQISGESHMLLLTSLASGLYNITVRSNGSIYTKLVQVSK